MPYRLYLPGRFLIASPTRSKAGQGATTFLLRFSPYSCKDPRSGISQGRNINESLYHHAYRESFFPVKQPVLK
jgi:hypothetical protein